MNTPRTFLWTVHERKHDLNGNGNSDLLVSELTAHPGMFPRAIPFYEPARPGKPLTIKVGSRGREQAAEELVRTVHLELKSYLLVEVPVA